MRHRCYIVFGDVKGLISVINLSEFLQARDLNYDSRLK